MTNKPEHKEKVWTKYVHGRIAKNKNFNCALTGPTGSGKSYAALSWAEELDPAFTADRIVFTPSEFMHLLGEGKLKPGSVVLFDEIGVAMNSKQHMTAVNRALSFCFQTYRHRNLIVFMTTPHLAFLDSTVRRLLHTHGVTAGIDYRKQKSRLKLFSVEVDQYRGKLYRKYLRVKKGNRLLPITRVLFGLPSEKLVRDYEAKKTAFTTALNKRLLGMIERAEEKELGKEKTVVLTDQQRRVLDGLRSGMQVQRIAEAMAVSTTAVSKHKRALEKKGYAFKPATNAQGTTYFEVVEEPARVNRK